MYCSYGVESHSTFIVVVIVQAMVFGVFLFSPMVGSFEAAAELFARQFSFDARPKHDQDQEEQEPVQGVYNVEEDPGNKFVMV